MALAYSLDDIDPLAPPRLKNLRVRQPVGLSQATARQPAPDGGSYAERKAAADAAYQDVANLNPRGNFTLSALEPQTGTFRKRGDVTQFADEQNGGELIDTSPSRISVISDPNAESRTRDFNRGVERDKIGQIDSRDLPGVVVGRDADPVFGAGSQQFQLRQLLKGLVRDAQSTPLSRRDNRQRAAIAALHSLGPSLINTAYAPSEDSAVTRINARGALLNQNLQTQQARDQFDASTTAQKAGEQALQLGGQQLKLSDLQLRGGELAHKGAERQDKLIEDLLTLPANDPRRNTLLGNLRAITGKGGNIQFEKAKGGVDQFGNATPDDVYLFDQDTGAVQKLPRDSATPKPQLKEGDIVPYGGKRYKVDKSGGLIPVQ